jgi:ferrous iron transport protein A
MLQNQVLAKTDRVFPLHKSKRGDYLKIFSLPEGTIRSQFIRVGIDVGVKVKCLERLLGGTIVLRKNRQEIAIGHALARRILVVGVESERR